MESKVKQSLLPRKRPAMPKGYVAIIAQALALSCSTVYKVAQGRHDHKDVSRLIELAKTDRNEFAKAIAEARAATSLLKS